MSESKTPTPADVPPKAADDPAQEAEAPKDWKVEADKAREAGDDLAAWKAEARKWENQAKANKAAAEAASKTEAEKVADRLATVERRATEAEARVLRRDIALDHKLTRDDAALLDTITDEGTMKSLAQRLASDSGSKHGNYVPREGNNPRPGKSESSWGSVLQGLDRQRQG